MVSMVNVQGACLGENQTALLPGASSAEPTGNPPAALARSGPRCVSGILRSMGDLRDPKNGATLTTIFQAISLGYILYITEPIDQMLHKAAKTRDELERAKVFLAKSA